MSSHLDNVEGQSRRNNVVIRGLQEEHGETWDDCEQLVRDTLVKDLELDREDVNKMSFERE